MSKGTLFIGGPADGRRIEIPWDARDWMVAHPIPAVCDIDMAAALEASVPVCNYRRHEMVGEDGHRYVVMVEHPSGKELLQRLLDAYEDSRKR